MPDEFARLLIRVRTPHGSPVPGADVRLIGGNVERVAVEEVEGTYGAALGALDDYLLVVERYDKPGGFDHRTLRAALFYCKKEGIPRLFALDQPDRQRSRVDQIRRLDENGRFEVDVTLDYLWFTHHGYPPTLGNRLTVLADGEAGWEAVAQALDAATRSIHVTTWSYQPTMELRRPDPLSDPAEREVYTAQRVLEARAAAGSLVRLLLWDAPFINIDEEARWAAETAGDNFEVLEEENPARRPVFNTDEGSLYSRILGGFQIGSYHQKSIVVDGAVGFCTGMNLRENDWDGAEHVIFDPRRCRFSRPILFRGEVLAGLRHADHLPRHDFMARVEGPAVVHLEENFRERWNRLIDRGAEYADRASPMAAHGPPTREAGPTPVQVIRTMPEPYTERGILDTYLRAIGAARSFIYIEDQYFRSVHISDAIADAVRVWPGLEVIVLTSQRHANTVLAGSWSRECFERIQRRKPGFELYTLRVGGTDGEGKLVTMEIDNHAKLMIVDDRFMTVGSCNINDRGFEFEGELNLAAVDAELSRGLRVALWREHLGGDARITGDIQADIAVWREHAARNRALDPEVEAAPGRHVFPFEPRAHRTLLFGYNVF